MFCKQITFRLYGVSYGLSVCLSVLGCNNTHVWIINYKARINASGGNGSHDDNAGKDNDNDDDDDDDTKDS